jgi:predicted Zn-dependent peptidase
MAEAASASVGFFVGTGGRDERDGEVGASHFLEHLLFKGTPTRSASAIAEALDAVGGEFNAYTTKEYTAFYVHLLGEDVDLGLDVLSDIVWQPALRGEDVEAERQVILEEILMRADDPADLVHELLWSAMFPGHGLGRDVLGTEATVGSMSAAQVREFWSRHYRPANVVVAAAGAVDHDAIAAGIERRFAGQPGGSRPLRDPPPASSLPHAACERRTEQTHVAIGMRAPGRHDRARFAVALVSHALGGGLSSRLFQEVRERRGLAYSVYSEWTTCEEVGVLSVYAGTAPDKAEELAEVLEAELDRVARDGITARELAVAKGHLRAQTLLSLEDSGARMSRIGRGALLHGEVLPVSELLAMSQAVTEDEAGEVAATVVGGPRTTAVVGPSALRGRRSGAGEGTAGEGTAGEGAAGEGARTRSAARG